MLNLTVAAIQAIKKSPEYLAKRLELSTGVLSIYEKDKLDSEQSQKELLDGLVPMALLGIKNILNDKNHPHFARVATDILDRSRTTSKISRTEHSVAPNKTTAEQDKQAQDLLRLLEPGSMAHDSTLDDPNNPDSYSVPNPRILPPSYVPVPEENTEEEVENNIATPEEIDEAIEHNKDINDLIM
jgi:hypothetical protein